MAWSPYRYNDHNIDLLQEILAIDVLRALEHRGKHILRLL